MIEATYSPEDNKLRLRTDAARFAPELYTEAKAAGFIWAPKQELLVAPKWTPEREDFAKQYATTGEIDAEETTAAERAEQRAERFDGYAESRQRDAESASAAFHRIADNIPLGQPILVGHHSERRARNDQRKIERAQQRAEDNWKTARYWERRAADLIKHAERMDAPGVRARRIKTLEAEARAADRSKDEAATNLKLWQRVKIAADTDTPTGVQRTTKAPDGTETKEPATPHQLALHLANYGHSGMGLWSRLERNEVTAADAAAETIRLNWSNLERAMRCREHLENRLIYERAVLAAQGHAPLPTAAEARAARPAAPSILNTRTPRLLQSKYRRSETETLPLREMTSKEYTAIYTDQKGTWTTTPREDDPDKIQFRVRVAILKPTKENQDPTLRYPEYPRLHQVFLTDKKECDL